ncbi:class F sortase [Arthrobacter rhombi]|uniref:class F sortase n=1 Tax=Arthrobacter rhombi TaxID=71253 RepID=UPI003FD0C111
MKHARKNPRNGRGRRITAIAVTATVGLVGAVLIGVGARGEAPPPSPPASEAIADTPSVSPTSSPPPTSMPSATPTKTKPQAKTESSSKAPKPKPKPKPTQTAAPKPLKRSQPVRLDIPAIGVDTDLLNVGLKADGSIGVPPLDPDAPAGWYKRGPSPGEQGPAVLLGHVTATADEGPAVFFKLGDLRKKDEISVTRADGKVAVFKVTQIIQTKKDAFSSAGTYANTEDAELRVITCGGAFDQATQRHADNIVVHAKLVSTHPA